MKTETRATEFSMDKCRPQYFSHQVCILFSRIPCPLVNSSIFAFIHIHPPCVMSLTNFRNLGNSNDDGDSNDEDDDDDHLSRS